MPVTISDADIAYAERILLKPGQTFDPQRRAFIQNLDTLDVQAVPGSGKTTALLAKLLILERKLPLDGDKGILVLSHTNVAVDEIRERIGAYCPKLFSYPHFIGTIQSFVDQFLAIPYFVAKFKKKPYRIDNEIYYEAVEKKFRLYLKGFSAQETKNAKYYIMANNLLNTYRFYYDNQTIKLQKELNSAEVAISRPRRGKNWTDFTQEEKDKIYQWMMHFKRDITLDGIFHFDDAYFWANTYLLKFPSVKNLLQKRFRLVFVDEMQDMEQHQYDILEKLFFDGGNSESVFQRIGDLNQAIFSGKVSLNMIWQARLNNLPISGSHRLTPAIAELVDCFALERQAGITITGLRAGAIKPHLIVYQAANIEQVLPVFSQKIVECIANGHIEPNDRNQYKAIGWIKEKEQNKTRIADYCNEYSANKTKAKIDYPSLDCYLKLFATNKQTLGTVRKSILNAIAKVLRLEGVADPQTKRPYTGNQFLAHLEYNYSAEARELKIKIFQWSIGLIRAQFTNVYDEIKVAIPGILNLFGKTVEHSAAFINTIEPNILAYDIAGQNNNDNKVNFHGFDIEVCTVHAAKGQTHTATLYLETFHDRGGGGSYESQRLSGQFNYTNLNPAAIAIVKQSSKMAYVGFSRPTHLLCVAVQKDRFDAHLSTIDRNKWEVIEI